MYVKLRRKCPDLEVTGRQVTGELSMAFLTENQTSLLPPGSCL